MLFLADWCCLIRFPFIQIPAVLFIVTIETQEFPVATVGRVVVVIVVLVMDRQLAKILRGKFASAPGTNPRVELERLLPIALIPLLLVATGLRNDRVQLVGVWACTFQLHSRTIPLSPAGTSLTLVYDGFVHDA